MKLRGAICGFGEVAARGHLPGWLARPGVSIAAVQDPISERRHLAMRLAPGVRVYDDLELMLDGEAPDFVDIATPPAMHATAIRAALEAGAHVLCEKPLCLEQREFDELTRIAESKSRVLMCVHNWKHAPAFAAARQVLDSGRIGALRYIAIDRLRTQPAGGPGQWRSEAATGGGILIDHGWHVFYLMHWLMGEAPASVSAFIGRQQANQVDDFADLRVVFTGERIARVHLSWRSPIRRTYTALHGDSAVLEIEGDRLVLTDRSGAAEDLSVHDAPDDSYHSAWFSGMAQEFERAIPEGYKGPISSRNLDEARAALGMVLGARQSANSGGLPAILRP